MEAMSVVPILNVVPASLDLFARFGRRTRRAPEERS
jgi:hypothetical protein